MRGIFSEEINQICLLHCAQKLRRIDSLQQDEPDFESVIAACKMLIWSYSNGIFDINFPWQADLPRRDIVITEEVLCPSR